MKSKVWVVVVDGVTLGHPCCAIHNCHIPLASNRHRFCPEHLHTYQKICAVVGCSNPVVEGSQVCANAVHQEAEHVHKDRGQARFQLKERLKRAQLAHDITNLASIDEGEVDLELKNNPAQKPQKIRAQFGRKRTHNEEVIVAPCGVIIARETFFGAEGVASVVVGEQHPGYDSGNCISAPC